MYRCNLVQAEDGEDFQEYFYEDGGRVPRGEDVGVEIEENGETKFYLLDGILYP